MPRRWLDAKIVDRVDWCEGLITIRLDADIGRMKAGQFVDLGYYPEEGAKRVARSYSVASAPGAPPEFFVTLVEEGAFTPHLFTLGVGDSVLMRERGVGMFTLDRVDSAKSLWLVSTGTGLAPYISMLRTPEPWERFERILVVHGVRKQEHLAYQEELLAMSAAHGGRLSWIPVVSREPEAEGVLHGRVTGLLRDGTLEKYVEATVDAESAQILLCGNPAMLDEMTSICKERGMTENKPRTRGNITLEAYW